MRVKWTEMITRSPGQEFDPHDLAANVRRQAVQEVRMFGYDDPFTPFFSTSSGPRFITLIN